MNQPGDLMTLPGIGPRLAAALRRAGIHSKDELRRQGGVAAWQRLAPFGFDCLNSLQALEAASRGIPKRELDQETRAELLAAARQRPREIWHISSLREWESALATGRYEGSTIGLSLAEVGFIHCSTPEQVTTVAEVLFAAHTEPLVALVIDLDTLERVADVRFEDGGNGDNYPHIYGPLPVSAVLHAWPAEVTDGELRLLS